jgi:hypothetical protein
LPDFRHPLHARRMAGITRHILKTARPGIILVLSMRHGPSPPGAEALATPDRNRSSSRGRGPWTASPPTPSCSYCDLAFGPVIGSSFGWGRFFAPAEKDRMPLHVPHGWHDQIRIADRTVKIYISSCRCDVLRILLPRTMLPDDRVRTVSSSLGSRPPRQTAYPPPSPLPLLRFGCKALSSGSILGWSLFFALRSVTETSS